MMIDEFYLELFNPRHQERLMMRPTIVNNNYRKRNVKGGFDLAKWKGRIVMNWWCFSFAECTISASPCANMNAYDEQQNGWIFVKLETTMIGRSIGRTPVLESIVLHRWRSGRFESSLDLSIITMSLGVLENQSFPWHEWNLSKRFSDEKHVTDGENVSKRLQFLPESLVSSRWVRAKREREEQCTSNLLFCSYSDFAKYCSEKKYKTYISKPDVGCQGRGIFITKNPARDIKP